MGHARYPYQDFGNPLRIAVGLDEDAFPRVLKQVISILSHMKYSHAFTHLKIWSFTPWVIMKRPRKLNMPAKLIVTKCT